MKKPKFKLIIMTWVLILLLIYGLLVIISLNGCAGQKVTYKPPKQHYYNHTNYKGTYQQ